VKSAAPAAPDKSGRISRQRKSETACCAAKRLTLDLRCGVSAELSPGKGEKAVGLWKEAPTQSACGAYYLAANRDRFDFDFHVFRQTGHFNTGAGREGRLVLVKEGFVGGIHGREVVQFLHKHGCFDNIAHF